MIDSHVHFFPGDMIRKRELFCDDPVFNSLYGQGAKMAGIEDVLDHMDKHGIEKSIAMGFPFEKAGYCERINSEMLECAEKYPGRFIPFAALPSENDEPDAALKTMKDRGFAGAGEIALYTEGLGPGREPWIRRIFSRARELGLILCFHVNEPVGHIYTGKYPTDFDILYRVIRENPGVRVILSHWGGGLLFYELMPEVRAAFADVYYDTAASPYLYDNGIYRTAIDIVGSRKILFGTDYPLLTADRYMKGLRSREIGNSDILNITGENVRRLIDPVRI